MGAKQQNRRERAVALYLEGHRQAHIARQLDVSNERVRQYLNESAVRIRSSAEQRDADYHLAVKDRAGEIEAAFWQLRDFDEVGRRLGLDGRHVERLLNDLWPDIRVFKETDWGGHQQFTNAELLDALRRAAAEPGMPAPMTGEDFDAWVTARGHDEDRPARITIMVRLGGWRAALLRADLPANEPRRGPGNFTVEVCTEAIAQCWRELGRPPSAATYDTWHRSHAGSPGSDMVRARLQSWTNAKVAAYPLVHGKVPPVFEDKPQRSGLRPHRAASVGRAYRPREILEWRSPDEVLPADPALVERAVRSHFEIEARLAEHVRQAGFVPLSPTGADPQFDLAWRRDGTIYVVEVKSATQANLETQSRLGFGQLLRYSEELRHRGEEVQPVLVIELPPEPIWRAVATRAGVNLAGPDSMLDLIGHPPAAERPA